MGRTEPLAISSRFEFPDLATAQRSANVDYHEPNGFDCGGGGGVDAASIPEPVGARRASRVLRESLSTWFPVHLGCEVAGPIGPPPGEFFWMSSSCPAGTRPVFRSGKWFPRTSFRLRSSRSWPPRNSSKFGAPGSRRTPTACSPASASDDFAWRGRILRRHHFLDVDRPVQFSRYVDEIISTSNLQLRSPAYLREAGSRNIFDSMSAQAIRIQHRWHEWVSKLLDDPLAKSILKDLKESGYAVPLFELCGRIDGSSPEAVRWAWIVDRLSRGFRGLPPDDVGIDGRLSSGGS